MMKATPYNFIFAITYREIDGKFAPTEYRRKERMSIRAARAYQSRILNMNNVKMCIIYKEIF